MGADYYCYSSLASQSIRLLSIAPNTSGLCEDLHIDLEDHSLDGAKFDALSYTWGPSTLKEERECAIQIFTAVKRCYPIFCGGKIVLVTKSLRDSLRRLRALEHDTQFERKHKRRKLPLTWADGVCINQNDKEEKAQQVLLMGKIYSKSNLMLAYLGDCPGEDTNGVQNAITIGSKLRQMIAEDEDSRCLQQEGNRTWEQRDKKLFKASHWWDWAIFLSRSWFQRTWVLQEIILSGREKSFVLCGPESEYLYTVMLGVFAVRLKRWMEPLRRLLLDTVDENPMYQIYLPKFMEWATRTHVLAWIAHIWEVDPQPSLLSITRSLLPQTYCSDPKDKIYGTLSFIADWRDLDQSILPVNYDLSTTDVFCRATKHVLSRSKTLDLVRSVPRRTNNTTTLQLPSWCPDYQQADPTPETLMAAHATQDSFCSASGSDSHNFRDFDLGIPLSSLLVRGCFCENVEEHSSILGSPTSVDIESLLELLLANVEYCGRAGIDTYGSFTSLQRTIYTFGTSRLKASEVPYDKYEASVLGHPFAALLASKLWDSVVSRTSDSTEKEIFIIIRVIENLVATDKSFASWLSYAKFLLQELNLVKKWAEHPGEFASLHSEIWRRLPEVQLGFFEHYSSAQPAIHSACSDRHLFRTSAGRIGMGHSTLKVVDQVWLLAGSKSPVLLRPLGNGRFEFVGEAYVDGLMFGEEWPESGDRLVNVLLD